MKSQRRSETVLRPSCGRGWDRRASVSEDEEGGERSPGGVADGRQSPRDPRAGSPGSASARSLRAEGPAGSSPWRVVTDAQRSVPFQPKSRRSSSSCPRRSGSCSSC